MAVKIRNPIHFMRKLGDFTRCGVRIDGYTIRHTLQVEDVTCKRCLKTLKNVAICPKCYTEFKKG